MSHKPAIPIIHHVIGTLCSVQPTIQSGVYKQSHCMVTGHVVRCSGDLPNDVKPTDTPSTHTHTHARTKKGMRVTASLIKSDSLVISRITAQQLLTLMSMYM